MDLVVFGSYGNSLPALSPARGRVTRTRACYHAGFGLCPCTGCDTLCPTSVVAMKRSYPARMITDLPGLPAEE